MNEPRVILHTETGDIAGALVKRLNAGHYIIRTDEPNENGSPVSLIDWHVVRSIEVVA